jgi:hypothetical protein
MNLSGSQLSLADWFGVLFINVLGTWHGSFGIDTPAGGQASPAPQNPIQDVKVFTFAPSQEGTRLVPAPKNKTFKAKLASVSTASEAHSTDTPQVLGTSDSNKGDHSGSARTSESFNPWLVGTILAASLVLLAIERLLKSRHNRRRGLVRTTPQTIG